MSSTAALILIAVFAVFIPALMLPGPDFVGVVRSSLTRGTRAGLMTTLGVTVGLGFYATLSLVGLAAVMAQYQWLAVAVRVAGALYLAYLGIRLIMAKAGPVSIEIGDEREGADAGSTRRSFLFGLVVTLTNPKAIVLFASVFAPAWLLALMVGLVMLASLSWYTLVTLFMTAPPVLARFRRAQHWIERIADGCFLLISGRILTDARTPVGP